MKPPRVVRLHPTGPTPEAARTLADVQHRIRRNDLRAVAIVFVDSAGLVGTMHAGMAGHMFQLIGGVKVLERRLLDEVAG